MSIPNKVSATSALTHPHQFAGDLAVRNLERLADLVAGGQGSVQAELTTDREAGYPRLHGQVTGQLALECQRCNRVFDWPLKLQVDLRLVFSEQDERAALQGSDPYRVENDELPIREMVEDEILLALPMLARCESCENSVNAVPEKKQAARKQETQRDNPFAALIGKLK